MENLINMKGSITFLPSQEGTTIKVRCESSKITFLEVTLTNDELASMMSRLANTSCDFEVKGLDKVGKQMEHRVFEFEYFDKSNIEYTCETAMGNDGLVDWTSMHFYGSQNSFFTKDGKQMARTTIRRWI
jgi:hypothetical protein